jgi:hypothetical protein
VASVVGSLALAATVVAAVTLGPALWNAPASTIADPGSSSADSGDPASDVGNVAAAPTSEPQPSSPPAPPAEAAPSPDESAPPARSTEPNPSVQPEPVKAPEPVDVPTAPATPTTPTVPTTPVVVPTTPPVDPKPDPPVPTVTVVQTADQLTFPLFSGTAEALATVQILNADGSVLVSTSADGAGAWSISDFGSSITGDPSGRQVVVRQVVDGVPSQPSAPEHLVVLDPPVIQNPVEGSTMAASDVYDVIVVGAPGASIQRIVNGEVRSDIHALDAAGRWSQTYGSVEPWRVALGMRYVDPESGRYGLTRLVSYTIS